ncbi:MAG TPA: MFS transporter [Chloroflexi bacterium]|nr:MFS transporter [Chloroflexota bacterium]
MGLEKENNITPKSRRNFIGGLWHGAFLALSVALTQPTTVISSFIIDLTGSTIWVGGLSTVLTVAAALPQIFVARLIENRPRKMPFLLMGIYLRVASWAVLAGLIYSVGAEQPQSLAWVLIIMLAVFYAGGGFANIPYTDIIGKVIPAHRRGAFFGGKQALAGPLAVGAAFAAQRILAKVDYPNNYALLFGLASIGLGVASLGFWLINEPQDRLKDNRVESWGKYWKQLRETGKKLKELAVIELLTGFSLMSLPFYVVYAREEVNAPLEAAGWYLLAQVIGGVLANLIWARLVDIAGSRKMVVACALTSTVIPILALGLTPLGWPALVPVFFIIGATISGRSVGFQSALLELAPAAERPTFTGLNQVLILPLAFLTLMAGLFLEHGSYSVLFFLTSAVVGAGALVALRWARQDRGLVEQIIAADGN